MKDEMRWAVSALCVHMEQAQQEQSHYKDTLMYTHGYLYFPYAYSTHFPPTLYVGSELSHYNSLPEGLFFLLRLLLFSFG